MSFIKKIALLIILCTPLSIFAQKKQKENPYRRAYREDEPIAFRLSGVASINELYGGKFSIDLPMKIVEQRGLSGVFGGRSFTETYITVDMGLLRKQAAFEDASVSVEWVYRKMNYNGFFFQISPIGVGGHRVLLPFGDSVAAPSSGIVRHPLTERKWYVAPSVSVGIGRDFAVKRRSWRGIPLIVLAKVGVTSLMPYRKIGYLIPSAEVSLGYRFPSFSIAARQIRRD
jgi:hypothetical protein